MKAVLNLLAMTLAIVVLIAWCVGCMMVFLQVAQAIDLPDEWGRALAVVAAGFGLWFALWSIARLTKHRL